MSEHSAHRGRRRFIHFVLGGVIAAPLGGLVVRRPARAAGKPKLEPHAERARQLGYTRDATSTSDPKRKDGAFCHNCVHFQGDDGDACSPCNIFPSHSVRAAGWYQSWISAG